MANRMDEILMLQQEEMLKQKTEQILQKTDADTEMTEINVSPNYKGKHPVSKEELAKRKAEKKRVYECSDPAVNPNHYKSKNGLEVIDFIEAFTEDLDGFEAYLTGSAMKYLCRWKHKNGKQDINKAIWFSTKLLRYLEEQEKKHETKNLSGGRDNRSNQGRTVVVEEQSQE